MKLITRRTQIESVVTRWTDQYSRSGPFKTGEKILNGLRKLDLTKANREQVDDIFGNDSWTEIPLCSQCNCQFESVVQFLDDSETMFLCEICLGEAIYLFP